jgi:large subunit ribosomal protein L15
MRDTIKKFPKLRGHGKNRSRTVNSGRVKAVAVSLSDLSMFSMSDPVTLSSLVEKGVVRMRAGRPPMIKIVANGVLTTAVTVTGVPTSATAKQAIEKAGGQVK